MRKPDVIPDAVTTGLARWVRQRGWRTDSTPSLHWDALNGCYFFHDGGVYIGVELDGYVHS